MSFKIGMQFDEAINWQGRLAHELPFIQSWLKSWNAIKVLDLACGSGRHTLALAKAGFSMTGSDLQEEMLRAARDFDSKKRCTFMQQDMCTPHALDPQDALLCLGNSLCLLPSLDHLRQCLDTAHEQLRSGGGLLLHVLNYARFEDTSKAFFPLKTSLDGEGQARIHFQKFIELHEDFARVHMLKIYRDGDTWKRSQRSDKLLRISTDQLQRELKAAGFQDLQFFGNMKGETYEVSQSHDIIVTARKAKES
jgi:SAM-dependent methyltransferase